MTINYRLSVAFRAGSFQGLSNQVLGTELARKALQQGVLKGMNTTGMQPLLVVEDKDDAVFTGLGNSAGFRRILNRIEEVSDNTTEKGDLFEKVVKAFIQQDKARSERFSHVWSWYEWPGRNNRTDIGIDLVARERDSGNLVGIQCKFRKPGSTLYLENIATFLTALGHVEFSEGIVVSTTENWGPNVENSLKNRDKPVARWGVWHFENSSIDWTKFRLGNPSDLASKEAKVIRGHQAEAMEAVVRGFDKSQRGKLIMPCGSGKTFTALRIAERIVGPGGSVLFLTPSISLLSQSMSDWCNDTEVPIKPFGVCSDTTAAKAGNYDVGADIAVYDLADSPSTNPETLVTRFNQTSHAEERIKVVFSTYQSLDVISKAQDLGLPEFDLIVSDEAHRTTGVQKKGVTIEDESGFRRTHNNSFLKSARRLYMTATPRIYGDRAKRKADQEDLTLASMDDLNLYGPEFHRLGFGEAVDRDILSDYKVVILDVDMEQVGVDLERILSDEEVAVTKLPRVGQKSPVKITLTLDNSARMVGCWNGLRKVGITPEEFLYDPDPSRRAVAFTNTVNQSLEFAHYFPQVVEEVEKLGDTELSCHVEHVDGAMNAQKRSIALDWLKEGEAAGQCNVVSNARCLTEGVDVPALDAILFLYPRRSVIDVVQAVGRVMRKAEGKRFGYIILPIAREPGRTPEETLNDSKYKYVWQVLNALKSHDDRFEAEINHLALTEGRPDAPYPDKPGDIGESTEGAQVLDVPEEEAVQGSLHIVGDEGFQDTIRAKVVDKYADPDFWQKWAATIREIAIAHENRIRALLRGSDERVRETFSDYLEGIRDNLNDGITEDQAIGMLSQHLVTKPVFDAVFGDFGFVGQNSVSRAMQAMIDALDRHGLERETADLGAFYRDVQTRVRGVNDSAARQSVIKELYGGFIEKALPEAAKSLGIAYTPIPVVDYVVQSVEDVLQAEFGASLSDSGVHVIDPFVGTGTFITRLLQSGIVRPDDLSRKYESELHANEILLLAYYIAAVNIETTYHDEVGDTVADTYSPFDGIVLTDTFEMSENSKPMDNDLFPHNNKRIERQKGLDIRVVIGNPPWSATDNREYPTIDQRVKETYADTSEAILREALYDPYVKAIRQASDRVLSNQNGGVVAFVTNGGFIENKSFDGFRKAVVEEFDTIYCFNLRGNANTSGEIRRKEAGGIFADYSKAGVAILLLIKKPGESSESKVYYGDIGDYLKVEKKLAILGNSSLTTTQWKAIKPNVQGDWINQRSELFPLLRPLGPQGDNGMTPVFLLESLGFYTGRDAWCYNSSNTKLRDNIEDTVRFYNHQEESFRKVGAAGSQKEREAQVREFVGVTPRQFHWRPENYRHMLRGREYDVDAGNFTVGAYRPFFKQRLYFNPALNSRIRKFPEIYPKVTFENLGIAVTGTGVNTPFYTLMTDSIVDDGFAGHSGYYPRWRYLPKQEALGSADVLEQVSNINPVALSEYRDHYEDQSLCEDDLFYHVYGLLHSKSFREAFAADLEKSPLRIPMPVTLSDFHAFAEAGRELAELHVGYEYVKPFDLDVQLTDGWDLKSPDAYRIVKMSYPNRNNEPDKTRIAYNAGITLAGIPRAVHDYQLGPRSALDWLIYRYKVTTHDESGINNDPNDWATERGEPRYILDLIRRVVTVSLETNRIVETLPELPLEN